MEIWKDIEGLAGYSVSNAGNVKFKNRLRKQALNHKGYPCLVLRGKSRLIHRLVACAFIANPNNLPTVNHIDGNKLNNDISNLEWASYSYNIKHSYQIGIRKSPAPMRGKFGYEHHSSKEVVAFDLKGLEIGVYGSVALAGEALHLDGSSVSKVCRGERKRAGSYRFAYYEKVKPLLKELKEFHSKY